MSNHDIDAVLREQFGFDAFQPGQREVIEYLLGGQSAAAVFPTGGGKSLCYQLPSLVLSGLTLVVSPLIALMKDQIDALTARGIPAQRLDSTLSADEYREAMNQIRQGELRLLYVAPERFNNERFREAIRQVPISLFAVDEAHCISEWGHNFRPDYLKLAKFAQDCGAERLLALTATATPQVLDDMRRVFEIEEESAVVTGFYRKNLTLLTSDVLADSRNDYLVELIKQRESGPTIVYVTLQRTAENVARLLTSNGLPAKAYHAGMKDDLRSSVQDWFIESAEGIVVATIAFGMGIDKSNIRYVYHYNLPKSLENYSQEIGRSGRDGEPSVCQMLACMDDMNVLENFVYGDTPTADAVYDLVANIFSQEEKFDVSYNELSSKHDIRLLVIRTLLTYLELDDYLEGGTPFYSGYQFKPILTSQEILEKFEGERREFLHNMFRQVRKARTWFHIDLDQAAAKLGEPRERLVRALDYLGEQEMLELKAAGVRNRYRRVRMPDNIDELAGRLHSLSIRREEREIARLRQVIDWIELKDCQVGALCEHFGSPMAEPCGHCTSCLDDAVKLTQRANIKPDESIIADARALQAEHPDVLGDPIVLSRLLVGVTSPKLTRAKLGRDKLFGKLDHMPFKEVLDLVSQF